MSYLRRWNGSSWEYVDAKNADYASSAGSADNAALLKGKRWVEKLNGSITVAANSFESILIETNGVGQYNFFVYSPIGRGVVLGYSSSRSYACLSNQVDLFSSNYHTSLVIRNEYTVSVTYNYLVWKWE